MSFVITSGVGYSNNKESKKTRCHETGNYMACEFIRSKNFTGFKCSHVGDFSYLDDEKKMDPYGDYECAHERRFEYKGVLRCQDCAAYYDESTQAWISER